MSSGVRKRRFLGSSVGFALSHAAETFAASGYPVCYGEECNDCVDDAYVWVKELVSFLDCELWCLWITIHTVHVARLDGLSIWERVHDECE